MKIRKRQLKEVIRNILLEQEEDWLGDDDEELYGSKIKTKSAEDYRSLLNSAILKEKQDLAGKKQLSTKIIKKVLKILNTIHLAIDNEDDSHAYVRHVMFDQAGKPHVEDISGIEMDAQLKNDYKAEPLLNPIVVIVPHNFDNLKISKKKNILEHEVNHIRNNFIKALVGINLNVEEVRNVLRKDLQGKKIEEVVKILTNEGRFEKAKDAIEAASIKRLIEKMQEYYEGVFADPADELAVDEFAVRIGKLQDYPDAVSNHKGKAFNNLAEEYSTDAAQTIIYLDKNATIKDVNRVVKNISKDTGSIRV